LKCTNACDVSDRIIALGTAFASAIPVHANLVSLSMSSKMSSSSCFVLIRICGSPRSGALSNFCRVLKRVAQARRTHLVYILPTVTTRPCARLSTICATPFRSRFVQSFFVERIVLLVVCSFFLDVFRSMFVLLVAPLTRVAAYPALGYMPARAWSSSKISAQPKHLGLRSGDDLRHPVGPLAFEGCKRLSNLLCQLTCTYT
jgi:hypothetical protein